MLNETVLTDQIHLLNSKLINQPQGVITCNGVSWALDPTSKHSKSNVNELTALLGVIPRFLHALSTKEPLAQLEEGYGFPCYPMDGIITKDGVHMYPHDPDMYPIAMAVTKGYLVLIYEMGITAVCVHDEEIRPVPDQQVIIRLD